MKKTLTIILAIMLIDLCVTGCSDVAYDTPDSSAKISTQEQTSTTSTTTSTTERSTATTTTTTTTTAKTTTTTTTATTTTATTTTATTTTTAAPTHNNVEALVWIPQSGAKYHSKANCSNMKNPSQVSRSEAIDLGYEPCKRCYK